MREPVAHHQPLNERRAYLAARSHGARFHAGIDLAAHRGTPVVAPEKATVILAHHDADTAPPYDGWAWAGYGPALVLLHGMSGAFHLLAHVEALRVSPGDVVAEGQQLAEVSQLSHCHWEVRVLPVPPHHASNVEISTDPALWLLGHPVLFDPSTDGCPASPGTTYRTPWACRPGNEGHPPYAIPPFPKAPA